MIEGNGTRSDDSYAPKEAVPTEVTSDEDQESSAISGAKKPAQSPGNQDSVGISTVKQTLLPEIRLEGNQVKIRNGDDAPSPTDHTYFGTTAVSDGLVIHTFTIVNSGNANLVLTGDPIIRVEGLSRLEFAILGNPESTLLPSRSTSFRVAFDPNDSGRRRAVLRIASNDS